MENLANIIESILFVSGDAVAIKDISEKSGVSDNDVLAAAKSLQVKYNEESGIQLLILIKNFNLQQILNMQMPFLTY